MKRGIQLAWLDGGMAGWLFRNARRDQIERPLGVWDPQGWLSSQSNKKKNNGWRVKLDCQVRGLGGLEAMTTLKERRCRGTELGNRGGKETCRQKLLLRDMIGAPLVVFTVGRPHRSALTGACAAGRVLCRSAAVPPGVLLSGSGVAAVSRGNWHQRVRGFSVLPQMFLPCSPALLLRHLVFSTSALCGPRGQAFFSGRRCTNTLPDATTACLSGSPGDA